MLGRIALRFAAIEALKGKTLVADNVLDSQIGALDIAADGTLRTDQEKPFISVYVEGGKIEGACELRSLHKPGSTDIMFEIGITAAMVSVDPETEAKEIIGVGIPATDPSFEFFLDVVGRQIVNALMDPTCEWAEIWRSLSSRVMKIERRRTSDAATGTRIAAHQLIVTLDVLSDPPQGEPLAATSVWARLFAKMESINDPLVAKKLVAMRSLVGTPDGVRAHEAQRRRFGMTLQEARELFDIAVEPAEATEPDVESVEVERTE